MNRPAAVLIGGPPATGKSTLAAALAPHLDAAILDLDVATGPLTRVVSDLRLPGDATMVWLHLLPDELIRRLTHRALSRDQNKIRDPASFLTGLDLQPPVIPHLALDASKPTATLVRSILDGLAR
jgi:shikimate kinase